MTDACENITFPATRSVKREKQDYKIIVLSETVQNENNWKSFNEYLNTWMHRIYISIQQNSHTFYSWPEVRY